MKYIGTIFRYLWALLAFPIVLATFTGNSFWAEKLVAIAGLEISPWDTGGEIVQRIDQGNYQTLVHRPVFDGLICERKNGFVQVDWKATGEVLPAIINDEIDYDCDGTNDFQIRLDTEKNKADLVELSPDVIELERVYKLEDGRAVRVLLKNKRR